MAVIHLVGAVSRVGSKQAFAQPPANGDHERGQNNDHVSQNPQQASPRALSLRVRPVLRSNVPGPQVFLTIDRNAL